MGKVAYSLLAQLANRLANKEKSNKNVVISIRQTIRWWINTCNKAKDHHANEKSDFKGACEHAVLDFEGLNCSAVM